MTKPKVTPAKDEPFTLDGKPCKIGVGYQTRGEKHGDERVPAKDLKLIGIMLTKGEFNRLFRNPDAWDAYYLERKGKPAMPLFPEIVGTINILGRFKGSSVTLSFGLRPHTIEFADCTLKSLKIDRQEGGLTALTLMVQCLRRNIKGDWAEIDNHFDHSANVGIVFGDPSAEDDDDEEQPELDIDHSTVGKVDVKHEKVRRKKGAVDATLN